MYDRNRRRGSTHLLLTKNPQIGGLAGGGEQRLRVGTRSRAQNLDDTGYVLGMGKKKATADNGIGALGKVELPALLTKEQVAEYFGVSPRTVEAWRSTNTGPVPIKIGKHLRWTAESIRDYISGQSVA